MEALKSDQGRGFRRAMNLCSEIHELNLQAKVGCACVGVEGGGGGGGCS